MISHSYYQKLHSPYSKDIAPLLHAESYCKMQPAINRTNKIKSGSISYFYLIRGADVISESLYKRTEILFYAQN